MRIGDVQKLRNCALGAEYPIKRLSFPNYGMIMNPTGQKVKGYLLSYKTRKPLNPKLQALSPNPTKTIGYRVTISNSTSAHGSTASETASGDSVFCNSLSCRVLGLRLPRTWTLGLAEAVTTSVCS